MPAVRRFRKSSLTCADAEDDMDTDSLIVNLAHATRMIQKGSMSVGVDKNGNVVSANGVSDARLTDNESMGK